MTRKQRTRRVGWAITLAVAAILLADAAVGLLAPRMLAADMAATGFAAASLPTISIVAALSALIYLLPRTAVLGAILITGFLGGAICAHVRMGELGTPPQIVCLLLGLATWAGLYLRDPRVRMLLPMRVL